MVSEREELPSGANVGWMHLASSHAFLHDPFWELHRSWFTHRANTKEQLVNLEAPPTLTLLVFWNERCLYTRNRVGIHELHTSFLLLPSSSKMAVLSLAQTDTEFVCKPAVKSVLYSFQNLREQTPFQYSPCHRVLMICRLNVIMKDNLHPLTAERTI